MHCLAGKLNDLQPGAQQTLDLLAFSLVLLFSSLFRLFSLSFFLVFDSFFLSYLIFSFFRRFCHKKWSEFRIVNERRDRSRRVVNNAPSLYYSKKSLVEPRTNPFKLLCDVAVVKQSAAQEAKKPAMQLAVPKACPPWEVLAGSSCTAGSLWHSLNNLSDSALDFAKAIIWFCYNSTRSVNWGTSESKIRLKILCAGFTKKSLHLTFQSVQRGTIDGDAAPPIPKLLKDDIEPPAKRFLWDL